MGHELPAPPPREVAALFAFCNTRHVVAVTGVCAIDWELFAKVVTAFGTLAWPAALLVIIFWLRDELVELIKRVTKIGPEGFGFSPSATAAAALEAATTTSARPAPSGNESLAGLFLVFEEELKKRAIAVGAMHHTTQWGPRRIMTQMKDHLPPPILAAATLLAQTRDELILGMQVRPEDADATRRIATTVIDYLRDENGKTQSEK